MRLNALIRLHQQQSHQPIRFVSPTNSMPINNHCWPSEPRPNFLYNLEGTVFQNFPNKFPIWPACRFEDGNRRYSIERRSRREDIKGGPTGEATMKTMDNNRKEPRTAYECLEIYAMVDGHLRWMSDVNIMIYVQQHWWLMSWHKIVGKRDNASLMGGRIHCSGYWNGWTCSIAI